jgi:hypothetical protein
MYKKIKSPFIAGTYFYVEYHEQKIRRVDIFMIQIKNIWEKGKQQEGAKNCTVRTFVICTLHQMLLA